MKLHNLPTASDEMAEIIGDWEHVVRLTTDNLPALDSVVVWDMTCMTLIFRPPNVTRLTHKWTRWVLIHFDTERAVLFDDQVKMFQAVLPKSGTCDTYWFYQDEWCVLSYNARYAFDLRRDYATRQIMNYAGGR